MNTQKIRNFSIIAHIDHGKSTLADRLLEYTGAVAGRDMEAQILDDMDLERERGITIKAHAVRLNYVAEDGRKYILNLIDTPGHVDFTYEVSRSLAACEGVLLVVDATQGVEAQTLANAYMAIDHNLEMIPVINKIDLQSADVERVREEIEEIVGIDASEAIPTSAKAGIGIKETLEAIVKHVPHPTGNPDAPLKALIFDSWFDNYQGVVVLLRIVDGSMKKGDRIKFFSNGKEFDVLEVGYLTPKMVKCEGLETGEVGYMVAGIRRVADSKIGDTITSAERPASEPLPGYRDVKPMVFSGLYPTDTGQYEDLRDALEKLRLNDSSFTYEPEASLALGFGFRCGFLGLLHMEIIQERLEREFGLSLLSTAPTVVYRVTTTDGEVVLVDNPSKMPDPQKTALMEEPVINATIMVPNEYIGAIFALCQDKRGVQKGMDYLDKTRSVITYELPLNEIVIDFYDKLKSVSRGYASLDYE
ncbi:MAG TPA: translation elongation factor 4, partial [Nitrospirota bacterium]